MGEARRKTVREMSQTRELYPRALTLATRWMDNDVVYFSYFDPVVNEYLIRAGVTDIEREGRRATALPQEMRSALEKLLVC